MAKTKLWRKPFDAAQKTTAPGKVLIDRERCKGCGFCTEFCPTGALKMSDEIGPKGYLLARVEDESKCLNCGLCEIICPEFGVHVIPQKNESKD
ncbi:MAG: 4Fe-4S binding protein [Dehalococcoidia bacterium]|nr:4Fe-4S binding protein [Dehalococcoidia bacterium]